MSVAALSASGERTKPVNFIIWVSIAAVCLMFRLEASSLPAEEAWYWRIWYVSVLQWLLWQELVHCAWRAPALPISPVLAIAFIGAFGASAFLLRPEFVNVFLLAAGVGLLATGFRNEAGFRIGACFLLILTAHVFGSSLVAPLHSAWATIDARALTVVLTLLGDQPDLSGTIVAIPAIGRALSVEFICSTTWVSTLPLFIFAQVTLLRHGRLAARDMKMMTGIFALTFVLNIIRLVLMAPSQEGYEYWHFGTGADLFSLATAILVFLGLRPAPITEATDVHAS